MALDVLCTIIDCWVSLFFTIAMFWGAFLGMADALAVNQYWQCTGTPKRDDGLCDMLNGMSNLATFKIYPKGMSWIW